MTASDVRRGPGWWMDLDGGWNPPEEWPENSPPLPGWERGPDGSWRPPSDDEGAIRDPSPAEVAANDQIDAEAVRTPIAQQPPAVRSQFTLTTAPPVEYVVVEQTSGVRRAFGAAFAAAITASMIAGGVVLLLLLF
ncbi:MAG: hypothetical protein ACR2P0_12745 [Acidimicrobiales bacterium]